MKEKFWRILHIDGHMYYKIFNVKILKEIHRFIIVGMEGIIGTMQIGLIYRIRY
jgi:hypothetical protein